MREYGSKFGITGKIVEQEVFGNPAEFMKKKRKIDMGHDQYLPFREAMHDVKTIQDNPENGIDPTDPEKEFANDLHASIAQELTPDDYTMLRFYTAVETVLDHFHGVDGFFEFDLEDDRTAIVTMDVTTNPNKLVYKADVILHIPSDGIDRKIDPEEYDLVLKKSSKRGYACYSKQNKTKESLCSIKREPQQSCSESRRKRRTLAVILLINKKRLLHLRTLRQ